MAHSYPTSLPCLAKVLATVSTTLTETLFFACTILSGLSFSTHRIVLRLVRQVYGFSSRVKSRVIPNAPSMYQLLLLPVSLNSIFYFLLDIFDEPSLSSLR